MNKRQFFKTLGVCVLTAPLTISGSEPLPRKYHKITKDWSFSCSSCTFWNDFNIYQGIGLSKRKDIVYGEIDNDHEYVLRGDKNSIYVNGGKCYEITNFQGDFVKGTENKLYEASFDFVKYLGTTPTERIIIISGFDYCIYALGRDYYKESHSQFGKGWTLERHEVYGPLTEEMHSRIKYFDFNRKTYEQYLQTYNSKLKELGLI